MFKVTIANKTYRAARGERLNEVLRRNGIGIEQPCGGKGTCGKCLVNVDGMEQKACRYVIAADITVDLPKHLLSESAGEMQSCKFRAEKEWQETMVLALDIGTTTLAMALVSTSGKQAVRTITQVNPQVVYGADVISRIEYCMNHPVTELQESLLTVIRRMAEALCGENTVERMYVAGNATMLHILLGENPSSMGIAPYRPVFLEQREVSGCVLGMENAKEVVCLPSISAFVGADLVAGLHYIGMPPQGKYHMLVDLGTNAEVVLFSQNRILCTSAAAGPCFEGANISCGMSAQSGAITTIALTERDECSFHTIADAPPRGICGTGIVDLVAELVRHGYIDKSGYMECGEFEIAPGVTFTQQDVRQFQLAKSAVYSAVAMLMELQGITQDEIESFYLSGGFSTGMNIKNAAAIGLLPKEAENKCIAVSNSSLLGTIKYACEKTEWSVHLADAEYVDLSQEERFTQQFISHLDF